MDFWVPGSNQQYILAEAQADDVSTEPVFPLPTTTVTTQSSNSLDLPCNIVDKIFIESRSRANFAKNLTFAIYTQEERRGKNCTGRVFGKAQHKGQLDPTKLAAVKEATFSKYPCNPNLVDITWRKECITAIDSGLRNEHRAATMKPDESVSDIVNGENILTTTNGETHHQQQQQQSTQSVNNHQIVDNPP